MQKTNHPRPPLESLACVNPDCDLYGQKSGTNLTIRKVYVPDQIRYLRCRCCQAVIGYGNWLSKFNLIDSCSSPYAGVATVGLEIITLDYQAGRIRIFAR